MDLQQTEIWEKSRDMNKHKEFYPDRVIPYIKEKQRNIQSNRKKERKKEQMQSKN